jgi:hypothetical protein
LEALAGHPHQLHVRMEDLRRRRTRRQVFDFFELAHPRRLAGRRSVRHKVNGRAAVKAQLHPHKLDALAAYRTWPPALRHRLDELCGPTAELLGY